MWLDILLMNRPALAEALEQTGAALAELRALLAAGDAAGLERYLSTAREFRRGLDR
jgi:prephenate dehydrogenase